MSPPKSAGKSEDIRTGAAKALLKARADIQTRFDTHISSHPLVSKEGRLALAIQSLPTGCRGLKVCDMPRSSSRRQRRKL
jgi:hypothetical protein